MLVDDEIDFSKTMAMRLQMRGYDVAVVHSGEEALKKSKEMPDLILLDVMMPVMNGYETCNKLRQESSTRNIPIIMLSAKFQQNDIKFGREMGAEAYVTKPFEPHVLIEKIRELLSKKKTK